MGAMRVEVLPTYKRRGQVCYFSFKLSWDEARWSDFGERFYTETCHSAYLTWDGIDWQSTGPRFSHDKYPPPREPEMDELRLALDRTAVECRALKSMGAAK